MPRFMPPANRPMGPMGYHQVPADIIEDAEALVVLGAQVGGRRAGVARGEGQTCGCRKAKARAAAKKARARKKPRRR